MTAVKLHALRMWRFRLDAQFFIEFTLVLNSVLLFWKLLVFEFLLGKSENILCLMFVLVVKIVPLLHALQLLMQTAERLGVLEIKPASLTCSHIL
jgi:hypothetical protein